MEQVGEGGREVKYAGEWDETSCFLTGLSIRKRGMRQEE